MKSKRTGERLKIGVFVREVGKWATTGLVLAALASCDGGSDPKEILSRTSPIVGSWRSECSAGASSSQESDVSYGADGRAISVDHSYGNSSCAGAPTDSTTSMEFTFPSAREAEGTLIGGSYRDAAGSVHVFTPDEIKLIPPIRLARR